MPKFRLLTDEDKIQEHDEIWLPGWNRDGHTGWIRVIEMIIGESPGNRIIRRANIDQQQETGN